MDRRNFLKLAGSGLVAGSLMPGLAGGASAARVNDGEELPELHLFSKHLQFLGYDEMADAAAELGFDGLDLTVRKGGHVEPEHFAWDLPAAIAAMENRGLKCEMMATDIVGTKNQRDYDLLKLARSLGVRTYRLGGIRYDKKIPPMESVIQFREQLAELARWNRDIGITGVFQNHSGAEKFGAAVWDAYLALKDMNPDYLGIQFDIRHAVTDGGRMWPTSFRLVKPQIRSIVLKDFKWAESDGKWQLVNTPIGKGMVDFPQYFRMLKNAGLSYPISLHCEYELGGAEKGKRELTVPANRVLAAIRQDVETIGQLWREAA